jgi:hypothetical protein
MSLWKLCRNGRWPIDFLGQDRALPLGLAHSSLLGVGKFLTPATSPVN